MADLESVVARLEELLAALDEVDEPARSQVFELLDGIDALHRDGLHRLAALLDPEAVARIREDPAVAWLLDAYAVGVDEAAAAEAALDDIRPYIESHGGVVELVAAEAGVVRVRMRGACAGCTASAVTLREGIERGLAERMPGFRVLEAEEDDAAAHPPPGPTLLQIERLDR